MHQVLLWAHPKQGAPGKAAEQAGAAECGSKAAEKGIGTIDDGLGIIASELLSNCL